MDIAPSLAPIAFLLGTWRGRGWGDYPTVSPFEYEEEITFSHVGKPFLVYHQKTWDLAGAPLHTEMGYLRPVGVDAAELVIAQPTGISEVHTGSVHGQTMTLKTVHIGLTPTAKDIAEVSRTITVDGSALRYRLDMAAMGQGLQIHLEAELYRV